MRKVTKSVARPLAPAGRRLIEQLAAARRLVLLLDVDGTLAPLRPRPELARVPAGTRATLRRLRAHPRVTLALISGRRAVEARAVVGSPVDWTIGNHGFEIARGGRPPRGFGPASTRRMVRRARPAVARAIQGWKGVWLEDKGWTLAVHVRGLPLSEQRRVYVRVRAAARRLPVTVGFGKTVLDLRPLVRWHKGTAVLALLQRAGRGAAAVYAGDDLTDEYAFAALKGRAVTVKVGDRKSVV